MSVTQVLHRLQQSGLTVTADGERLIVTPADRLTDKTRQLIRDNKLEIVAALKSSSRAIAGAQSTVDELTYLVRVCSERYSFTEAENAEALAIALADPHDALTCFRAMAATHLEPAAAPRAARVRVMQSPSPNLRT